MYIKKISLVFFSLVFLGSIFSFHPRERAFEESSIKRIVIDAGHGGHDPGASGAKNKEKDIALSIALEVSELLKKELPGLEVIMTRGEDEFIELNKRADMASSNKADFFVSIHCNANNDKSCHGTETYVMGLHKEDSNLEMIMNENKSILLEDNYEETYEGFDPSSPSSFILFSLIKNAFLERSIGLAKKVEGALAKNTQMVGRGVKQAGFLVLWMAGTPSILIETGFISNSEEEKYLSSDAGRKEVATSITSAIKDFALD